MILNWHFLPLNSGHGNKKELIRAHIGLCLVVWTGTLKYAPGKHHTFRVFGTCYVARLLSGSLVYQTRPGKPGREEVPNLIFSGVLIFYMTPIEEQEQRRPPEKNFFIPAGALIGLGAGLIAGQPGPGILIGLGLGFLARAFIKPVEGPASDPAASHGSENRWIFVAIGFFMIVIGVGILWAPTYLWPYVIGIFLIVLGIIVASKSLMKVT